MSKHSFSRVEEILAGTLKNLKLEDSFRVYPISKNWEKLVGPTIASKTKPDYVQGKILFVSVENSVWIKELDLQKNKILEKIRSLQLDFVIEQIRFRMKS